MSSPLVMADLAEILRNAEKISHNVRDLTRTCFGDPFTRLATESNCLEVVDSIIATQTGNVWLNEKGSVILTWSNVNGRLRVEVSSQCDHYAPTITAVHEYFQREGLMARGALLFE